MAKRAACSGRIDCVLPAADEVHQVARPQQCVGHLDLAQRLPGEALLIAAIVDGELFRIAQLAGMPPQNAHAERMKRGDLRPFFGSRLPSSCDGPLLHFAGGFIGKRDGQNAIRLRAMPDQFGNPIGHHPRLARPAPASTNSGPLRVITASR